MRDDEQLIEMVDLADLLGEIFAAFGVQAHLPELYESAVRRKKGWEFESRGEKPSGGDGGVRFISPPGGSDRALRPAGQNRYVLISNKGGVPMSIVIKVLPARGGEIDRGPTADRGRPAPADILLFSQGRALAIDAAVATAMCDCRKAEANPLYAMDDAIRNKRQKYFRWSGSPH